MNPYNKEKISSIRTVVQNFQDVRNKIFNDWADTTVGSRRELMLKDSLVIIDKTLNEFATQLQKLRQDINEEPI